MRNSVAPGLPHVTRGRLRALAVGGAKRSRLLPDIPTVDEASGLRGFEAGSWLGLLAPAGTPQAVIARLNDAAMKAVQSSDTRARLVAIGGDPIGSSARDFAAFLRADYEKNGAAVKQAGLKIE